MQFKKKSYSKLLEAGVTMSQTGGWGSVGCGSICMGTPGPWVLKLILSDRDLAGCGLIFMEIPGLWV